jgi:hypothetical protein
MSATNIGLNLFYQCRTVSRHMSMPLSKSRSSTFLRLSGNRAYVITTMRVTSSDELKNETDWGTCGREACPDLPHPSLRATKGVCSDSPSNYMSIIAGKARVGACG